MIKEFYVHKDELDEDKLTLLHGWCLEACNGEGENINEWLYYFNNRAFELFGVDKGEAACYSISILEDNNIIPFSSVRSHLGLPPLKEETPSSNVDIPKESTPPQVEYISAGLSSPVEMMQRLIDGEELYERFRDDDIFKYHFKNNKFFYNCWGIDEDITDWSIFSELLVKKETLWYDNIDEDNPPLCKVWDDDDVEDLRLVLRFKNGQFLGWDGEWDNAIPTGKFKKDFML